MSELNLSILILAHNEGGNLGPLIERTSQVLSRMELSWEVVVIDGGSIDGTCAEAEAAGAKVFVQANPGYGNALREGFERSRGEYVLCLDADLSHDPEFIARMWDWRDRADVVIASRYVSGGSAEMPWFRWVLSRCLNVIYGHVLAIGVKDMSSGFRMYRSSVLRQIQTQGRDFDLLEELLLKIYAGGWRLQEVPFEYRPRKEGRTHARLISFARSYLKTLGSLWQLRNSIQCADYDFRAFYSRIPLQRWWQRQRHRHIRELVKPGTSILDVGCGSSKILVDLPLAVGLDPSMGKLRFMRRTNTRLLRGSGARLPFADNLFETVISSQVIEHCLDAEEILDELVRVAAPGGSLIVGTPDYDRISWVWIEKVYGWVHRGGYADEHVTHYTQASLKAALLSRGCEIQEVRYVAGSELIIKAKKS
ncbi:MAG: glycosyltransferase [Candidatus Omnitrophica bacterium]|nr:glycosyltransferase [Candidatus Omnitrophota bacterium]